MRQLLNRLDFSVHQASVSTGATLSPPPGRPAHLDSGAGLTSMKAGGRASHQPNGFEPPSRKRNNENCGARTSARATLETDTPRISGREYLTPIAAAISALASLACCLPLGIAGAVGALGLSVALERLRPWLILIAVILLGLGLYQLLGQRKCQRRSPLSLILFGLSATVVLAIIIFPQKVADILAAIP
jgi:hypothetical protein